jgi:FkbM family methyltransferase
MLTLIEIPTCGGDSRSLRFKVRGDTVDAEAVYEVLNSPYYRVARSLLDENAVVIDVGAHIGSFSILSVAQGAYRVLALEPIPSNYNLLVENVSLNDFQSEVQAFNVAAWSSTDQREMPVADDSTGGSGFYYGKETVHKTSVQCVRLGDLMDEEEVQHCDLLKLDCEGAEFEILSTLSPAAWRKIKSIVLEYHLFADYDLLQLQDLLTTQGFQILATRPERGVLGYILAVRPPVPVPACFPILQPLELELADSSLTRVPILGRIWHVVRQPIHNLVVYYLNKLITAHNRCLEETYIYLGLLNQQMAQWGKDIVNRE